MKHAGKARKAAYKLIFISLILIGVVSAIGFVAAVVGTAMIVAVPFMIGFWVVFVLFTLYFFRDPTPKVPMGARLVVSPAHGKVDVVDTTTETDFMGGEIQRISIFLSVINVHVQNAPISGKITRVKYTEGQFINAMKADCAAHNENVYIGFEALEPAGQRLGVRLIAGAIARRIVPFVVEGDEVACGERISLIQFGSRADVYLPKNARIKVKVGDKVVGGETVLATFD
jgi:phosphatidylserine decarboxylase